MYVCIYHVGKDLSICKCMRDTIYKFVYMCICHVCLHVRIYICMFT